VIRCAGDVLVRVGRGARDNDALVKDARGNDLWLHARGAVGAHVVIPSSADKGGFDGELVLDAAHLAAHFSSLRGAPRVDVQHTRVKNVRKPGPGAPAGLVLVSQETVLHVRVDEPRLAALLAAEVPAHA
jgi:predicted ribosome quality control (RQC) complex YloA/Tae2 family protein